MRTFHWMGGVGGLLAALGAGRLAAQEPAPPAPDTSEVAGTRAVGEAPWPIFRVDPGLSGLAQSGLADSLEVVWTFEAGGAVTSSPVVADGLVFFGADDEYVRAVGVEDGVERWKSKTEDIIEAPPLVVGGSVFIGSHDGWFYAFDAATGEQRWKAETGDKIVGGANWVRTPEGLTVVVGSYDANLYGFDGATGELRWKYTTDNYVNGTPAIHDGRAIFGGCDSVLHVVDVTNGERIKAVELGDECHVAASAAFVDGRAYFGHYGNEFVCIDVEAGTTVWSYASPRHAFFSSPSIGEERVVFGGRDRKVHCVGRADGKPIWTFPTRRIVDSSPVIAGDKVIVGSGDGRLYLLSLADGKELWSYDIGKGIVSSPAVVAGRVYVGANDKRLYCFGPASEEGNAER